MDGELGRAAAAAARAQDDQIDEWAPCAATTEPTEEKHDHPDEKEADDELIAKLTRVLGSEAEARRRLDRDLHVNLMVSRGWDRDDAVAAWEEHITDLLGAQP